ncbi:hypothetical protein SNK05_001161 [Fusarium graminearum]
MASEFTSTESNAMQVYAPSIVFFLVTPLFIAFRFWSRITRRTGLGWDDMTIIISFSCAVAVQTIMMVACNYGFGQHIKTLTPSDKIISLKLYYIAQIFYKLTMNLAKISMLLLYLRIFVHRWFRRCCFTLMGLVTCYMIASVTLSILQCYPISGAWDKSMPPTCIDLEKFWLANAGFSIATDSLILMLPMHPICTSKLSVTQKRGLIMLLATGGGLVITTSIVRTTTLSFTAKTPDTTCMFLLSHRNTCFTSTDTLLSQHQFHHVVYHRTKPSHHLHMPTNVSPSHRHPLPTLGLRVRVNST